MLFYFIYLFYFIILLCVTDGDSSFKVIFKEK